MPSSERLYYSDSFLKAFTGTVIDAREVAQGSDTPVWQLSLDRTAFYPTSGGQPFDTGALRGDAAGGGVLEIVVDQVEEDQDGTVWHFVREPLAKGTSVRGDIDWNRRFDHMQQHTGQHLLSAVFARELQMPTVSFHLGESISTIDLAGGALAHHSLERVERIANEIIAEDRGVAIGCATREEAQAMLASGELRKLPDREGAIRLIEIAGYDRNACGGTHVHSTGQIGGLLVRGVEKVSRGVRVEFVCGLRAVRAARADSAILGRATALLSASASDLPDAVTRLLAEVKAGTRERQKLREDLAALQAVSLLNDARIENGLRLIVREWKDRDRDYVRLLASRTAAASSSTAVIFCARDAEPVRVFVARSADLGFNCGQMLREALAQMGLRGGGSADLAQGDVPMQQQAKLVASLADTIRNSMAQSAH